MSHAPADVRAWLTAAGFERFAELFEASEIDGEALVMLNDEHLKELGIAIGPRTKLRKAIDQLNAAATTASAAPTVSPSLAGPDASMSAAAAQAARVSEGERRQLTVMFIDLVGSTALSTQLDPEDLRGVLAQYHKAAAAVIQELRGFVAQYLGDGILAYFGYPQALGNEAERAIRAGLAIIEAIQGLAIPPGASNRLAARVGIHTGQVVVGDIGAGSHHEQLALGETPNVAARIQALAAPNSLLVSSTTWRLAQRHFDFEEQPAQELRGLTQAIRLYRVVAQSDFQDQDESDAQGQQIPVVGRDAEMRLLGERWAQSSAGRGQVVLLGGEPGIGKSRLVEALRRQVVAGQGLQIVVRCSPYHVNSALHPAIEQIERVLKFQRDESALERLAKLDRLVSGFRFADTKTAPLLAALLSIDVPPGRYPPLGLNPSQQRQKTLDTLTAWMLEEAQRQPVLAVYEDLHWADASMIELLSRLVEQAPTARLLLVFTFRAEFQPSWPSSSHVTHLTLGRFSQTDANAMIQRVLGGLAVPAEVLEHVVAKADGVPLFIEELLRMIIESGLIRKDAERYVLTGPLSTLAIPATLQDSLMARLDRLASAREVAQLAATLGREFSGELIHAVAPMGQAELDEGLARLVQAELIYRRGQGQNLSYLFKHALIRDAAYQTLLKSRRLFYHERIGRVLEERFADIASKQPELLAHHFTEAGLSEQAVRYWKQAGVTAMARSANIEAITHLNKGLELLQAMPKTTQNTQSKLDLHIALGSALVATKGPAALEVEAAYAQAYAVCQEVEETEQLFPVLWGLWNFYLVRGDLDKAHEVEGRFARLAQLQHDPMRQMWRFCAPAMNEFYRGDFASARAHLEEGIAQHDPAQRRAQSHVYLYDAGVTSLSFLAWTLWALGYPEQAVRRNREAVSLARALASPFILARTLPYAAVLHQMLREAPAVEVMAEAAVALATEQGFSQRLAWATNLRGWALAQQGQGHEGVRQIRQGLAVFGSTGQMLWRPYFLGLLAQSHGAVAEIDQGLAVLDEALTISEQSGERHGEAEIHRLKGELLAQQPGHDPSAVEACYQLALDCARLQGARSFELRAAMALARLWQQRGQLVPARELLEGIYAWFTEGFETADLRDARALLEDWSR